MKSFPVQLPGPFCSWIKAEKVWSIKHKRKFRSNGLTLDAVIERAYGGSISANINSHNFTCIRQKHCSSVHPPAPSSSLHPSALWYIIYIKDDIRSATVFFVRVSYKIRKLEIWHKYLKHTLNDINYFNYIITSQFAKCTKVHYETGIYMIIVHNN